jgi:predicted transcriptional regulator of viral defense system
MAVRRDLLVLPDATGRVVDLPELIDVVAPLLYLVTGGRAFQHHDLTDQHFFTAVVLVPRRVANFSYRGEKTLFLLTEYERIWGWSDDERPRYATPERAIVDALSHARYGVSFQQALTAMLLVAGRDSRFMERLVVTVSRYSSAATARRVGLLVDRHFGTDAAAPFRELIGTGRTPVRLRSTGTADGPVDRTWRVRVNVSTEVEAAT